MLALVDLCSFLRQCAQIKCLLSTRHFKTTDNISFAALKDILTGLTSSLYCGVIYLWHFWVIFGGKIRICAKFPVLHVDGGPKNTTCISSSPVLIISFIELYFLHALIKLEVVRGHSAFFNSFGENGLWETTNIFVT